MQLPHVASVGRVIAFREVGDGREHQLALGSRAPRRGRGCRDGPTARRAFVPLARRARSRATARRGCRPICRANFCNRSSKIFSSIAARWILGKPQNCLRASNRLLRSDLEVGIVEGRSANRQRSGRYTNESAKGIGFGVEPGQGKFAGSKWYASAIFALPVLW